MVLAAIVHITGWYKLKAKMKLVIVKRKEFAL